MRTLVMRQEKAPVFEELFWRPLLAALVGVFVALLLCVTLAGPAGADDDDDDDGGEYVPRQVVVKIKPGASIGAIERKFGVTRIERLPGAGKIYLLRTRQGVNPANLANRMEQDSRVLYAEPNFRAGLPEASKYHKARPGGEPTPGSDPAPYRSQYAVGNLNLTEAHGVNRGAGSVVAVIDTGAQAGHPELSGNLVAGYDFVGGDGTPADVGNGRDDDRDGEVDETVGHGTHVAGIVALAAPRARIMPLRALDSEGRGTTFGVAEAIRYAVRNDADVVNLSLGSSRETELLEDLIGADDDDDEAGRTVFVAAAGNDGNSIEQYPAAEDGAISVTSVGENGKKSGFANYGSWVSVAAPGDDIHSPFPVSRYATWDGTSMATPFVAAQAALIRGERPSAGSGCVAGIIQRTAEPLTANLGAGHADVEASTKYAANPSNSCAGFGGDDDGDDD